MRLTLFDIFTPYNRLVLPVALAKGVAAPT